MTDVQLRKRIQKVVQDQFGQAKAMMNEALKDSGIDPKYHGIVRCLCRQMMAVALQQKEERDALYKQFINEMEHT